MFGADSGETSAKSNHVKLPKLALHSFSDDVTQWLTLWDSFMAAVHDNDHLAAVDKFNYLKSFLTGTALKEIAGLTPSATNTGPKMEYPVPGFVQES